MTSPQKAERRVRSAQGSSTGWGRDRMNQTHRKGRKAAKRRLRGLRRILDRTLVRLENWLDPDETCRCLNLYECGRPHATQTPVITGLEPLSPIERDAAEDQRCPRCAREVRPHQWVRAQALLECPHCGKYVDPEADNPDCICGQMDAETAGAAPYEPYECPIHKDAYT